MQEIQIWSLGQEDPLEEEMATYFSIPIWKIAIGVHGVAKSYLIKWECTYKHIGCIWNPNRKTRRNTGQYEPCLHIQVIWAPQTQHGRLSWIKFFFSNADQPGKVMPSTSGLSSYSLVLPLSSTRKLCKVFSVLTKPHDVLLMAGFRDLVLF